MIIYPIKCITCVYPIFDLAFLVIENSLLCKAALLLANDPVMGWKKSQLHYKKKKAEFSRHLRTAEGMGTR